VLVNITKLKQILTLHPVDSANSLVRMYTF